MHKILILIMIAVVCLSSSAFQASAVSTPDEYIISIADDKYTPLYTTSPDATDKSLDNFKASARDNALTATQTTFLALIAGYLILFKSKGIDHSEKMHRRK